MRTSTLLTFALLSTLMALHPTPASSANPQLVYPNGGETFFVGHSFTVSWINPPGTASVELQFSSNNGLNWFHIARISVAESYIWVPNTLTTTALISVSAYDSNDALIGSDRSDGTFTIKGNAQNVRFALHRKPAAYFPTVLCDTPSTPSIEPNYSPNYDNIPCNQYTVNAPLGASTVYIVIGQVDSLEGVAAASFGIDYDGRLGQGTGIDPQFVYMSYCADGLVFVNSGGFGDFPAPKGGVRVTWNNESSCQREVIGSHGVHAVVGALYVYAYSADLLRITPNNNLCCPTTELAYANCFGGAINLLDIFPPDQVNSLTGRVQFGAGTGGYSPCATATCSVPIAAMDVNPNTLNLNAGGKYVSASIELPTGHDPADVIVGTVKFNGTVTATNFFAVGDFNNNGVSDFTVKFPRADVEAVLAEGDQVQVTITGAVGDQCTFTGTEMIRVIRPHVVHPNGGESYIAGARALLQWANPNGWSVDHAQIHYSADGGDTWTMVADHVTSQSYVWAVPQEPTQDGRVRVVLIDGNGMMGYDTSDGSFTISAATGVESTLPTRHQLYQNAPNPFRGATRASFDLPQPEHVTLKVFDLGGRVVRVLADEMYPAGTHEVSWNSMDAGGKSVAGGIYFLHITAGPFSDTKRMYLQR